MEEKKQDHYQYEKVAGTEEELQDRYDDENAVNIVLTNNMTSATAGPVDRKFLYVAACAANIAAFTCGTAFGWTSPEIPRLKKLEDNPLGQIITPSQEAWIGSFLPLGAAIGPFAGGYAANNYGRKKTFLMGIIPFILAFAILTYGSTVNAYFFARFLSGLGVGCIFTVIPMYVGEISDNEVRGALGSFMQLFITIGLLFSYMLGPYIPLITFNQICIITPTFFLITFYMFIPDSPYYLIQSKDYDGAEAALMKIRSKSKDGVQKELEEIKSSVEEDLANKASFMDIFKSPGLVKALIISVGLVAMQQFSGINVILFYAQDIFTDAGSSLAPEICTIIIGVVQVLSSGLTPALVERRGKRFLLLTSALGMCVSQGALAYFFYLKDGGSDISKIGWLPVASLVAYIITYCLGFGPLPWAVLGELFPGNIKSVASTATASGCWVLGFLITKYFGLVADTIGKSGSFGFFALCCLGAAAFVFKCVPETTGKSLQQIQDILNGVESK